MLNPKCKICRRLGVKLFLKGERCLSPKCALLKKPYPPGLKTKKARRSLSEYSKELREKQKLKNLYNLKEKQFKNYVKEVLEKRGKVEDTGLLLIRKLEKRLDNVIFRLGFAFSRAKARQLVSHDHFVVNGKRINIPSYQVKKEDKISLVPSSRKIGTFKDITTILKKHKIPSWLKLDIEKLEGEVIAEPTLEEVVPPAEISIIFEYYSR